MSRIRDFIDTKQSVLPKISLVFIFVLAFGLRFLLLTRFVYPPSGDAGGDLYFASLWRHFQFNSSSNSIVGGSALGAPPLYYFMIVIPFTTIFGTFLGIQLYMAFVPSLIVFPAYFVLELDINKKKYAIIGAFLISFSPPISQLITWNASFNAFGMVFLLAYFAFLARAIKFSRNTDIILSGLFLSFVAGSHELTLYFGIFASLFFILILTGVHKNKRKNAVIFLKVFSIAILFSLVYIPIYLHSIGTAFNLGYYGGITISGVARYFLFGFLFAFGQQGIFYSWRIYLVPLSLLSILYVFFMNKSSITSYIMLSFLIESFLFGIMQSVNWERGIYFIGIPLYSFLAMLLYQLDNGLFNRNSATIVSKRRHTRIQPINLVKVNLKTIFAVFLGVLVITTTIYSSILWQESGTQFYKSLSNNNIEALSWIKNNTPNNSTIYSSSIIGTWVAGYADRSYISFSPLSVQATKHSFLTTLEADYIYMGNYNIGNNFINIGYNYPSSGSPIVYLNNSGDWIPFLFTQPSLTLIKLQEYNETFALGGPSSVRLQSTMKTSNLIINYQPYSTEVLNETISFSGNTFSIKWIGYPNPINQVISAFLIYPSSYYYYYNPLIKIVNPLYFKDFFSFPAYSPLVNPMNFYLEGSLTNGSMQQHTNTTSNWSCILTSSNGNATLSFTMENKDSSDNNNLHSVNSFNLIRNLNITYFLINATADYNLYTRLINIQYSSNLSETVVFQRGNWYIFKLIG